MSFCSIRKISLCALLVLYSCTPSQKYLEKHGRTVVDNSSIIRVNILKTGYPVRIATKSKIRVQNLKTRKTLLSAENKKLTFVPDRLQEDVLIEAWDAPLMVNDKPYRGSIELHNVAGKIFVINAVKLEEYLYSVVASEMSPSWPLEAIKSQAIAARTYAYYNLRGRKPNSIYDLDSTTKFQVYKGMDVEGPLGNRAVQETRGIIMSYENKPILALFHSTCGGRIIDNKYVWGGEDLPYLEDKTVPYGTSSPHYKWQVRISLLEIQQLLDKKYRNIGPVSGLKFRKHNERVVEVLITHRNGTVKMTGNEFRMLFPDGRVKSQLFTARKAGDGLMLHGRGWGHGVGMCQYSAKEMAERGSTYDDILKYFYKDITITKL
ncbi:MAG: SpoIID/LytB domain-containing protein [Spirochaetota bacterium]